MSEIFNYLKEKNVNTGITLHGLITFILYILTFTYYYGYFIYADLQFLLGAIIGVIFSLKFRKPHQSITKYGIITGIGGGILSAFLIALYETFLFGGNIQEFFIFLAILSLSGGVIGLLIGAILSFYFMYREVKGEKKEEEYIDEDFFKDLIEDN